ncbi:helix-turn-helix domain-containing protein [Amycolatopsis pithecellobii]|uniref:helix-turn-helix domain-containing protein n=1 Tax=Amycolatopsis pithecellobii TaxID=664692 RepID=UPI0012B76EF6|nr:helix-turn-helix transcriptional regulator [Amycolatopsis pithecellobii]
MAGSNDQDQLNDLRRRSVGARVKMLRVSQNLTQQQLADLAGLPRSAISSLEATGRNITLDTLYGIADGLGVHAASLLDDRLFRLPRHPDPDAERSTVRR